MACGCFPEPVYSAFPGDTPEYASKTYRYSYQSLVTPSSVFDYDTESGKSILLKQQEVPGGYDASQYVSERQWVTARDGVKVPLSDRLQEGFRTRRQHRSSFPVTARMDSVAGDFFGSRLACSIVAWLT